MRYVQYYNYDCSPRMNKDDIDNVNEIFSSDKNLNPMINAVFHNCVKNRIWDDVPEELDTKVIGWNWKIKDTKKGYVEIITEEPLTPEELKIMERETEAQISDGYNENPFEIRLASGKYYSIVFHPFAIDGFKEE